MMLYCGNLIMDVVDKLCHFGYHAYMASIVPIVNKSMKSKKTDYVLMRRLNNQRTVIVFEIKHGVGSVLGALKRYLAQLFLECC